MEPLLNYFLVSTLLFVIGVYGLASRRNALRMLFAVEIVINAATLNFVAFSRYLPTPTGAITGQTVALFAIALAAAEAAVGLAIILVTFRIYRDIDVSEIKSLRG